MCFSNYFPCPVTEGLTILILPLVWFVCVSWNKPFKDSVAYK